MSGARPDDTVIALECSRCLDLVRAPIQADLDENFDLKVIEMRRIAKKTCRWSKRKSVRSLNGKIPQNGCPDSSGRAAPCAVAAALP